jgi:hypothetical protein
MSAKEIRTVNEPCGKAINHVIVLAATHKYSVMRPSPDAMALNIDTHANYSVDAFLPFNLGKIASHPKFGEVWFEDQGANCVVNFNGHPADVVVQDLGRSSRGGVESDDWNKDLWNKLQQAQAQK